MKPTDAPSLQCCAAIARALEAADDAALEAAAQGFARSDSALVDLLRYLHLFFGFPRVIHAFGVLHAAEMLPQASDHAASTAPAPASDGEQRFRLLYQEDADRVLARLGELDPVFRGWILDHAYGATGDGHALPLKLAERIAVLALAATGCWHQCRSHVRAALRCGVAAEQLLEDRNAAAWLCEDAIILLGDMIRAESQKAES